MKRKTTLVILLVVLASLSVSFADTPGLGTIFAEFLTDIGIKDITYGVGGQVYYWKTYSDIIEGYDILGRALLAELGLSIFHLSYYYKTAGLSSTELLLHQPGIGIRVPGFWRLGGDLSASVLLDNTFQVQDYGLVFAVEFNVLKFLRFGDYEHALSLRAQTNILNPLGDIAAGLHFSKNYTPIEGAIVVTPYFADSSPKTKLTGWFDEKDLTIDVRNASGMKMKNVKIALTPTDSSKLSWFEITPPPVTELPRKSTTIVFKIRSLESLDDDSVSFHLNIGFEGRGKSKYLKEFEIFIPTKQGTPPPIPEETPAGLI